MNILCITHADFETPGVIEKWAGDRKYNFRVVKPYQGEILPDMKEFDWLIIMGGPQGPSKVSEFPYLAAEIQLAKLALSQHKKMLGFCLGAQIIGEALGLPTERSPEKEIGVYPINLTAAGQQDALLRGLPDPMPVIHWHNDMPGINENTPVLASSHGCPRQIVRYRPTVYGFQCHLEINLEGMKALIEGAPEDLSP